MYAGVIYFDALISHARFALPLIGVGLYVGMGFMFAIGIAHRYVASFP